jgi:hypothetical protein
MYSHKISSGSLPRNRKNNPKIHMGAQKCLDSQSNLEKKEQS